jgi:hypothetical protein
METSSTSSCATRVSSRLRARLATKFFSRSTAATTSRVKSACNFISNFEQALVAEARAGGFDGVVCGHIHKAEQRMIGTLEYLNCGDWVESCTALVEHEDGRIELLDGLAFLAARDAAKAIADNSGDDSDETDPWLQRGVAFDATILLSGDAK